LILDMRLPGMSGLELQRQLQGEGVSTPVIFVTADVDGRLRTQMEQAGAVAVLSKPCDPEELTRLVQAAIAGRRLC
jgi:FixJ family two-component response regulator